jgi:hypothetical protein
MFIGDWDAENRYQVQSAVEYMHSVIGWRAFDGVEVRIIYEAHEDKCQYSGLVYNDSIVFYVCKGRVIPYHLIYHEFGHIYRNRYATEYVPPAWQPIEATVDDDNWGSVPALLHPCNEAGERFADAFANYMSENLPDDDWLSAIFADNMFLVRDKAGRRAASLPRTQAQRCGLSGPSIQPHAGLPYLPR